MTDVRSGGNVWVESYIRHHKQYQSRYEIDLYLLQAGCDPNQLETIWQILFEEELNPPRLALKQQARRSTLWKRLRPFVNYNYPELAFIASLIVILLLAFVLHQYYMIMLITAVGRGLRWQHERQTGHKQGRP